VAQRFRFGIAVLVAGLVSLPAFGQEVELGWKFEKGKTFFQTMKTTTNQSMTIMGQDVKQDQDQEFVFSWTVKDVADKAVTLEQKIEAVNMNISIGTNKISYNSRDTAAGDNPLSSFFKPLVGSAFTVTLDPTTMKVTNVAGREEFVKKLTDANPAMTQLLKVILSEEQLKQMAEPPFLVAPDKGKKVKANDTWERTTKLAMGPIGTYDAKYTFTYQGPEKFTIDGKDATYQKVAMKTDLTYKAPDAKDAGNLPFKIEGGSLKATEAGGTIWFDPDKGRVAKTEMTVKLDGTLTISVAEQKAEVKLTQTQKTTTSTSDTLPAAGAATTPPAAPTTPPAAPAGDKK
jgi:hypothetical protein